MRSFAALGQNERRSSGASGGLVSLSLAVLIAMLVGVVACSSEPARTARSTADSVSSEAATADSVSSEAATADSVSSEAATADSVSAAPSTVDTIRVRGRVDVIGNEPFTRQRLAVGPDSGFVLTFPRDSSIALDPSEPVVVEILGRPYRAPWQGRPTAHLEVYEWRRVQDAE